MEISNISTRSMYYETDRLTTSVKMSRKMEKGEGTSELAQKLKSFGIDISKRTYAQIHEQVGTQSDDLLGRLREFKGDTDGMSQEEKSRQPSGENVLDEMFGEEGYWGVKQTSQRISEFVVQGAGDDLERLKDGREGMIQGFKEAEKMVGGKLPDISYETMAKSLEAVDERIRELGGAVIDLSA